MKKKILKSVTILLCIVFIACGSKKETAASIAQKWCDLNGKVQKAEDVRTKESAGAVRNKFEREMEEKYKSDTTFLKEVAQEVNKCEAASEER